MTERSTAAERAGLFSDLLPSEAICEDTHADADERDLFAEERALIAEAVPKRRAEFTAARMCARRALARLGRPPVPLLSGGRGEPLWPPGVTGSLTHCDGYRAAAVARTGELLTIGIDAEPHAPLPSGVFEAASLESEREPIAALADAAPGMHWRRLLFSAKESVYKAWYPITHRWLDFSDVRIILDPSGHFTADVLHPHPVEDRLKRFPGRWVVHKGLILTATSLAADPRRMQGGA